MTGPRGRRPGHRDTRGEIVAAARHLFATRSYAQVSMRAVAREANVDPALVHHYFESKQELFLMAMADVSVRPSELLGKVAEVPSSMLGPTVIMAFTSVWDEPSHRDSFAAIMTNLTPESGLDRNVREFLISGIAGMVEPMCAGDAPRLRATLAITQILGMAMARYVLRMEPLASMPREGLARLLGPTIQHYLIGRLDPEDLVDA